MNQYFVLFAHNLFITLQKRSMGDWRTYRRALKKMWAVLPALTLLLGACAPASTPRPPVSLTPFKLCTSAVSGTQVVAWYAYEKGLFAKYGLEVELVAFENGTTAATAMIAGQVDACQIAGPSVINAAIAGQDLVMIGGLFNKHVYVFVTQPEIQDAEGLRGKTVAVTKIGSATDTAARAALEYLGLDPDKDVTIIESNSFGNILAGMKSGEIAASVFTTPNLTQARQLGYNSLVDLATLPLPYQHVGIATSKRQISEHRPQILALMKAISEAIVMAKSDPQGMADVQVKYLGLDSEKDKAAIQETYEVLVVKYLVDVPPYPTLPGLQALADAAAASNSQAAGFKAETAADMSLIKELEDSGFFTALAEGKQ